MASDLNQADLVVKAMSDMEKHLEIEKESLLKRLELLDANLFNVREAKRIFLTNRGASSSDELATPKDDNNTETHRRGTPESWLLPQYKLLGSKKAIEKILEERKAPVEIEDLVKELYDTQSEDEFKRARNSLSAGLRRGAEEGFWQKVGRSFYEANSAATTNGVVHSNTTAGLGLTQNQDNEPETEQPTAEYEFQQSVV